MEFINLVLQSLFVDNIIFKLHDIIDDDMLVGVPTSLFTSTQGV